MSRVAILQALHLTTALESAADVLATDDRQLARAAGISVTFFL